MANPYVSSPAAAPYPAIAPSPYAVQSVIPCPPAQFSAAVAPWCGPLGWNPYAFAQAAPAFPAAAYPAIHPAFAGMAQAAFASPATCIDPVTGTVVPQPYPAAQTLLPIRPLITAQPDPVQMAALCGVMAPQACDPYSAMAQACMPSPLAVSPVQAALRQPVYLSPIGSTQVGVPCAVTPGIPC